MTNAKFLNKKEIKEILNKIQEQWSAKPKLDYAFLKNQHDKLFIINKEIANLDTSNLRINSVGIYFGEVGKVGIRLSIEGAQLIGPHASKNVHKISREDMNKWMQGHDLETEKEYEGFTIIKYEDDFLGTGKFSKGTILNYIGKERYVHAEHD